MSEISRTLFKAVVKKQRLALMGFARIEVDDYQRNKTAEKERGEKNSLRGEEKNEKEVGDIKERNMKQKVPNWLPYSASLPDYQRKEDLKKNE